MAMRLLGRRTKAWLFYLKHLQCARGKLSFNIVREICSYFVDLLLPHVTSTSLRFFNTFVWEPEVLLRTRIQANQFSTWVELEDGRVFCCGGWNMLAAAWNVAYLLGSDGAVEELPSMLAARYNHGVIQVRHIYVFGGCKF